MFELNWVRHPAPNAPEPWLRFELDNDKNATTVYRADLRICARARCACHSVLIDYAPHLPDRTQTQQRSRWFWIDVRRRSVVRSPELKDAQTFRLAEFVRARLDENAWDELQQWFWTAKIQSIEKSDPSKIEIDGLPEAENGEMVPFVEVFPLGLSLNFTFENAAWAADEQYCVQSKCTCTELVLSFLQLKDSAGTVMTTAKNVPACRYNYRSRALNVLARGVAGTPPLSQLLAALHGAHPSLDVRLELHHRLMQSLYLRRKAAQLRKQLSNLGLQPPAGPLKIGRNVPCPCGSGKKFKKCCGV